MNPELLKQIKERWKYCMFICLSEEWKKALASFGEKEYEQKPFNQGTMYKNYEDFKRHGAGAVIWYKDEIVSSASSFISYNNDVELDISTSEKHRRKRL